MRAEFEGSLQQLQLLGYNIAATPGTASYYASRGIAGIQALQKPTERERSPTPTPSVPCSDGTGGSSDSSINRYLAVLDWIRDKRIDLVINIPEGTSRTEEVTSGYMMRRTAVDFGCSLLTNIK
jgi:hypothetical protein